MLLESRAYYALITGLSNGAQDWILEQIRHDRLPIEEFADSTFRFRIAEMAVCHFFATESQNSTSSDDHLSEEIEALLEEARKQGVDIVSITRINEELQGDPRFREEDVCLDPVDLGDKPVESSEDLLQRIPIGDVNTMEETEHGGHDEEEGRNQSKEHSTQGTSTKTWVHRATAVLKFILLASVLILAGWWCNSGTHKPPKKETEAEVRARKHQEVLSRLETDYEGCTVFSSDDDEILTYELQEAILRNPILILKDFDVSDVSRGDSLWTFKLGSEWSGSGHIAELTCTEPMAREILAAFRNEDRPVGYYAAKILDVKRIRFVAMAEGSSDGDGEIYSEVVFKDEPPLFLKGELLEVR